MRRESAAKPSGPQKPTPSLTELVAEIENLLRAPRVPQQIERANSLLVSIARSAQHGRVAKSAMHLMSAMLAAGREPADESRINAAFAELRAATEAVCIPPPEAPPDRRS